MNGKNNFKNVPEGAAAMPDHLAMPTAKGYESMLGFAPGGADASAERDGNDDGR